MDSVIDIESRRRRFQERIRGLASSAIWHAELGRPDIAADLMKTLQQLDRSCPFDHLRTMLQTEIQRIARALAKSKSARAS